MNYSTSPIQRHTFWANWPFTKHLSYQLVHLAWIVQFLWFSSPSSSSSFRVPCLGHQPKPKDSSILIVKIHLSPFGMFFLHKKWIQSWKACDISIIERSKVLGLPNASHATRQGPISTAWWRISGFSRKCDIWTWLEISDFCQKNWFINPSSRVCYTNKQLVQFALPFSAAFPTTILDLRRLLIPVVASG